MGNRAESGRRNRAAYRDQPVEIEEKVRRATEDGGKSLLVLYPSATPHEQHTPRLLANAERYIEAGLKYGSG